MAEEAPLSPHEIGVLVALRDRAESELGEIAGLARIELAQARGAVERLKLRGFVEQTKEVVEQRAVLTVLGLSYASDGTPELRILERLRSGAKTVQEAQTVPGLEKK